MNAFATTSTAFVVADFCISFDAWHAVLKRPPVFPGRRWRIEAFETVEQASARIREIAPFGARVLVKTFDESGYRHEVIEL